MARQREKIRPQPDVFWAWLAGFIDGDGCIGLYGAYKRPLVSISQKERHILDVIVRRLGVGSVVLRERGKRQIHGITFGSGASQDLCRLILPYLVTPQKIERAKACLSRKPISVGQRKNSPEMHPKFKEALSLYESGLGSTEIGRRLGICAETVLNWMARAGVKRTLEEAWEERRGSQLTYPYERD